MPLKEATLVCLKPIKTTRRFASETFNLFVKNTMGSDLKIADGKIFALLCSDERYPHDTLIAERRVREDWTVTSVLFPSQGILWITEIEW